MSTRDVAARLLEELRSVMPADQREPLQEDFEAGEWGFVIHQCLAVARAEGFHFSAAALVGLDDVLSRLDPGSDVRIAIQQFQAGRIAA